MPRQEEHSPPAAKYSRFANPERKRSRSPQRARDYGGRRRSPSFTDSDRNERRRRDSRSTSREHTRWKNDKRSRSSSDSSRGAERKSSIKVKIDKSKETFEQKRARRLSKRLAKDKKRAEREKELGAEVDTFGDPEIHKTFVWAKKLQKDGQEHFTIDDIKKQNRKKQVESRAELEKVRERRLQYERERASREEEVQLVQREKEVAQFKLWEGQEDSFHLKQAQLRSEIRIRDGRAKPVDLLAKYISSSDDLSIDIHEPYTYIEGLSKRDLEDLLEDITTYRKLDAEGNVEYWNDVTIVVEEELSRILRTEAESERRAGRQGINTAVVAEVSSVFKGKTLPQLIELEREIRRKVSDRSEGVDVTYWENLLQQIRAHMAKMRLRERHQSNLKRKLEDLKREQGIDDSSSFKVPSIPSGRSGVSDGESFYEAAQSEEELHNINEYESGQYSPRLIPFVDIGLDVHLIELEDDLRRLKMAREQVSKTGSAAIVTTEDHIFEREAKKGMGDDEAQFSVETQLDQPTYVWSEKYRPRKPRYFNRVHTGFEWNKYNQTHYDLDNPPPKVVQGYKFNIFYPDLIDKTVTPRYTALPCKDNTDFSVLRISAGPPYEDIAFKIVNREWEYSYKRGYRCQFHNNIFQLWFHFKRYRYRR